VLDFDLKQEGSIFFLNVRRQISIRLHGVTDHKEVIF